MTYRIERLPRRKCAVCGKQATLSVVAENSLVVGFYCACHGKNKLRWLNG